MAELRQIPFDVVYAGNSCSIEELSSKDRTHVATVDWAKQFPDCWIHCSCNLSWRIPKKKSSDEEIEALFMSHLSFASRLKTRTD